MSFDFDNGMPELQFDESYYDLIELEKKTTKCNITNTNVDIDIINNDSNNDDYECYYEQSGNSTCEKCRSIIKKCFDEAKLKRKEKLDSVIADILSLPDDEISRMFSEIPEDAKYANSRTQKYLNERHIIIDMTDERFKLLSALIFELSENTISGNLTIKYDYYKQYFNKKFTNNTDYSISIVFDAFETYEIAFKKNGVIVYDTPFCNDVIHELMFYEVRDYADAFHIWSQNPEYCEDTINNMNEPTIDIDFTEHLLHRAQ